MKKLFSFLLTFLLIFFTVSCTTNEMDENIENTEDLLADEMTDSTTDVMISDDNWEMRIADDNIVSPLKEAFVSTWNAGCWSMDLDWTPARDEVLKDVMIFESTKQSEGLSGYYCLVHALVHLKEMYRNDGSIYYVFSDGNDKMVDVYMFSKIAPNTRAFAFDVYGFFFQYEDAIARLKISCGEKLVSIIDTEQRLSFIEAVNDNGGVSGTYGEIRKLLEEGNFVDAQQLYYKTNGLTYRQSRECLQLLTEYELLLREISPIREVAEDIGGTFTLESYRINSWQDKDYSNDENDMIVYVEYHCRTTNPLLGDKKHFNNLTIPVTLNVEEKTFVTR